MADSNDKIIEEAKALQEYQFPISKQEGKALLAYITVTSTIMSSVRFRHLLILEPELIVAVALVKALDPKAECADTLSDRLIKLLDPEAAAMLHAIITKEENRA